MHADDAAERHAAALPHAERKQRGAWLTPMSLAQPTAARTLEPLLAAGPRPLRIVDPAVGGGAFLLAALRALRAGGMHADAAAACLFGVDTDDVAAGLAAAALARECHGADPADFAQRIRAGDGLLELAAESFDAVLTNPPWETLQGGAEVASRIAELRPRFLHQGRGKLFTYRLFVERAFQLLRPGGRLGLIVPASLWFDRDAEPLRRLLLEQCEWQWLFGFENRRRLFAIDSRYRFGVVIATKGGCTNRVQVAFGRTDAADWAAAAPKHVLYARGELRALSPSAGTFVEVADRRDLDLLMRMHQGGEPLVGDGSAFAWRQGDFNMTADRGRFVLREAAERAGHSTAADGIWRRAGHPDLLPLYQGAMIQELQPNAAAHDGGVGHATRWVAPQTDRLRPAWLVPATAWQQAATERLPFRLVHRALSNATNERTMIACLLADHPTGNSLGVLVPARATPQPLRRLAAAAAVLASLAFDWALRIRLGGTNLNGFVLADCVLPRLAPEVQTGLAVMALQLSARAPWQRALKHWAAREGLTLPAPTPGAAERAQLLTKIDVVVGRAYGLAASDIAWIVRGCELEAPTARNAAAKGFWRVDRHLPPRDRRPNRWLAAVTAS